MNISEAIAAVEAKTVAAAHSVEEHFTLEGLTIGQWRDRAIKAEGDLRTLIEKVAEMEAKTPKEPGGVAPKAETPKAEAPATPPTATPSTSPGA